MGHVPLTAKGTMVIREITYDKHAETYSTQFHRDNANCIPILPLDVTNLKVNTTFLDSNANELSNKTGPFMSLCRKDLLHNVTTSLIDPSKPGRRLVLILRLT